MIEKKENTQNNTQGGRKMDEDNQVDNKPDMVATLQARKEVLEAELSNKNKELKMLCIQEAELTGILPPETPLEPGESPPVFRRRVGTVFTYPENLLSNNKKSTEDDMLTALELECKIQRGIAEAALGLANEAAASKSVRRKHRLMYQQSQQRLAELETKLNTLRQTNGKRDQKQRKKPRPPLGCENEPAERVDLLLQGVGVSLSPLQHDVEQSNRAYWEGRYSGPPQVPYLKHSATYGGRSHHEAKHSRNHLPLQRHASGGHLVYSPNNTVVSPYYVQANTDNQEYNCWPQNPVAHGEKVWYATAPRQIPEHPQWEKDRFGSFDRRQYHNASVEARNAEDAARQAYYHYHPRHGDKNHSPVVGVLLPNQTYPEHSLGAEGQMQGSYVPLKNNGNIIHAKEYKPQVPLDYKLVDSNREKRLVGVHKDFARRHESKLNVYTDHELEYNVLVNCHVSVDPEASVPRSVPRTQSLGSMESHDRKQKEKQWYETSLDSGPTVRREGDEGGAVERAPSRGNSTPGSEHGSQGFDALSTEVPVESPLNHTVVQPGKWQPYREVSKPFEMSDFYKYSTKFRKLRAQQGAEAQQKAACVPPQPAPCPSGEICSAELLQWYQDRNIPCSATLV